MTQERKKGMERAFAEEAARCLGATWDIGADRESPDFMVAEDGAEFGLEVTELFAGRETRSGSVMKRAESDRQKLINNARVRYEDIQGVPLEVRLEGYICEDSLGALVDALVPFDFPSLPIRSVVECEVSGLRARAMKAFRPVWYNAADRRGWVNQNPEPRIIERIECKARELARYREAVTCDIRLLIVANRINNSGKLTLRGDMKVNLCGFEAIYFYSRPEYVKLLIEG